MDHATDRTLIEEILGPIPERDGPFPTGRLPEELRRQFDYGWKDGIIAGVVYWRYGIPVRPRQIRRLRRELDRAQDNNRKR